MKFVRAGALSALLSLPLLGAVNIYPVPVKPVTNAPYQIATAYSVSVVEAGNPANSVSVGTHLHQVTYDNGSGTQVTHKNVYYTHFSFGGGTVNVNVTLNNFAANAPAGTFSVSLSPLSYGFTPSISGNVVSFTLHKSRYVMLSVQDANSTYPYYLIILADPLETNAPASSGSGIFNVISGYSADNNYGSDAQPAIQAAVDAASPVSGIVYVPPGVYKIQSPIHAKSNVSVYLAPGAYLRIADDLSRTTLGSSKLYLFDANDGSNITNFKIYGRGTLDANGIGAGGHLATKNDVQTTGVQTGPLRIKDASNITLDGIVLREANAWSIFVDRDDGVHVMNTKVVNYVQDFANYRENDGFDLAQCSDSTVTHGFVFTADDAVCFKGDSGFDSTFTGGGNGIMYDLVLWTGADGCRFGGEMASAVTDSFFKNVDIVQAQRAIAIHATEGAATFNHIGYADIRCEKIANPPGFSSTQLKPVDFLLQASSLPDVTDVSAANVTISQVDSGAGLSVIEGKSGSTFNGVAFKNLTVAGTGVTATNSGSYFVTNSYATNISFAQGSADTNVILGVANSGTSGNWTTGYPITAINDGNTTNEARATNTQNASVTFPVANMILTSARVYKDNNTYSAAAWKLEYQDPATGAWILLFDFTACGTAGWNSAPSFSSVLAKAVRLTFQPVAGGYVGINDVEVYGH